MAERRGAAEAAGQCGRRRHENDVQGEVEQALSSEQPQTGDCVVHVEATLGAEQQRSLPVYRVSYHE